MNLATSGVTRALHGGSPIHILFRDARERVAERQRRDGANVAAAIPPAVCDYPELSNLEDACPSLASAFTLSGYTREQNGGDLEFMPSYISET